MPTALRAFATPTEDLPARDAARVAEPRDVPRSSASMLLQDVRLSTSPNPASVTPIPMSRSAEVLRITDKQLHQLRGDLWVEFKETLSNAIAQLSDEMDVLVRQEILAAREEAKVELRAATQTLAAKILTLQATTLSDSVAQADSTLVRMVDKMERQRSEWSKQIDNMRGKILADLHHQLKDATNSAKTIDQETLKDILDHVGAANKIAAANAITDTESQLRLFAKQVTSEREVSEAAHESRHLATVKQIEQDTHNEVQRVRTGAAVALSSIKAGLRKEIETVTLRNLDAATADAGFRIFRLERKLDDHNKAQASGLEKMRQTLLAQMKQEAQEVRRCQDRRHQREADPLAGGEADPVEESPREDGRYHGSQARYIDHQARSQT